MHTSYQVRDQHPGNNRSQGTVVAGDDKNFAASVAIQVDVMLCVLTTIEAGKNLCRPQAPICSVQLQGGIRICGFCFVVKSPVK